MFSEKERAQLDEIIEKGQDYQFYKSNKTIELAVKEWQENVKSDKEAYDKIYKKVVKNDHYLSLRYSNIDDTRRIQIIAELYVENIIDNDLFDLLDSDIREQVFNITRIKK